MITDDYLDKLEAIEQGYDDDFKWVNQDFIVSLISQISAGKELTENQKQAIDNIYDKAG